MTVIQRECKITIGGHISNAKSANISRCICVHVVYVCVRALQLRLSHLHGDADRGRHEARRVCGRGPRRTERSQLSRRRPALHRQAGRLRRRRRRALCRRAAPRRSRRQRATAARALDGLRVRRRGAYGCRSPFHCGRGHLAIPRSVRPSDPRRSCLPRL